MIHTKDNVNSVDLWNSFYFLNWGFDCQVLGTDSVLGLWPGITTMWAVLMLDREKLTYLEIRDSSGEVIRSWSKKHDELIIKR